MNQTRLVENKKKSALKQVKGFQQRFFEKKWKFAFSSLIGWQQLNINF